MIVLTRTGTPQTPIDMKIKAIQPGQGESIRSTVRAFVFLQSAYLSVSPWALPGGFVRPWRTIAPLRLNYRYLGDLPGVKLPWVSAVARSTTYENALACFVIVTTSPGRHRPGLGTVGSQCENDPPETRRWRATPHTCGTPQSSRFLRTHPKR